MATGDRRGEPRVRPSPPDARTPVPGTRPEPSTPFDPAAGGEAGARSRWSALLRWRDWNIPAKLAAVILVPVAFAVVLGAVQIGDQVERADSYRRVDELVAVNDDLRKVLTWLQRERTKAAVLLTTGSRDVAAELAGERQSADYAREELLRAVAGAGFDNEVTRARYRDVTTAFDRLAALRPPVGSGSVDSGTALAGYTSVIRSLLDFDRAATQEVSDPGLAGTATALHDLEAAKEEVYYQQGLVAIGIARGGLDAADLDALRASQSRLDERTADFRAIAAAGQQAEYDRLMSAPGVRTRADLLRLAIGDGTEGSAAVDAPLPINSVDWNSASELTSGRLSNASAQLGAEIKAESAALQDEASDAAGLASVVLLLALAAAAAVIVVIGRQLLRSLSALRGGALDVARNRLPAEVARIRDATDVDPTAEPVVEPVAVLADDEIGQVARAFDAVHRQALRLAAEQASLRANYSNVFVNLSRRSQGLVQRQLHLLERLERDEEDADQLATLFQLDHLATRMRRNNENLMVLSGSDLGRRAQQPVELADLLRAAVSEIEHYQRVVIQPPPTVLVVGYVVGDLVRLTAELLDNAAAFSAPATQVAISSLHTEGGTVRIEVVDRGIGMTARELADANARLADTRTVDASTSRRMGLFVVGRLADRHGVQVRLRAGAQSGVRATITVPADLVTANVVELPPVPPARSEPPAIAGQSAAHTDGRAHGQVSGHVNGQVNGHANGHVNGFAAGRTNGHANGQSAGHPAGFTTGLPRRRPATGPLAPNPTWMPGGDGAELPETLPDPLPETLPASLSDPLPQSLAGPRSPADPLPDAVSAPLADALSDPLPEPTPDALSDRVGDALPPPRERATRSDGVPLPRRTRKPIEPDPSPHEAPTEALFIPAGPAAEDDSGWWDTAPAHEPVPVAPEADALHETTPIFDEMVSAWFRAVTDDPNSTAADVARGPSWDFPADQGFDAARAVSAAEPAAYTSSGLPRRTPRQNLLPGSAEPRGPRAAAPGPGRDPDDLRSRLSSYQRGVHRARGAHHAGPAHGDAEGQGLDLRGARWRFAADAGWQAAEAVTRSAADEHTAGALPRRTPRERLLPGSLDPAAAPVRVERDAEALRSRLGSFQRGVGRGRSSLARRHPDPGQEAADGGA